MSDLIDRAAAIEALEEKYFSFGLYREQRAASQCIDVIKNLPSAQPERKKGKWIYTKKRLIRGGYVDASECSVCNKRIMPHLKPNFCPNCGAEMEVEHDH